MAKRTVTDHTFPDLPSGAVVRLTRPLARFLQIEAAGGIVLVACTVVALLAANSPWRHAWHAFWETPVAIEAGAFRISHTVAEWVNDGLMTIFFFVVGLEIKRELVEGELADRRRVALPVAAAIGGAAVPAVLFAALRGGTPDAAGWAVPMATDIAFAVGCLSILGRRVPHGLKVLVLTLAIVDDLLAVAVIALFYSHGLEFAWLGGAVAGFLLVSLLHRLGVRPVSAYAMVGVAVWFCMLKSGVHPTLAGAFLGLLTPTRAWVKGATAARTLDRAAEVLDDVGPEFSRASRLAAAERAALVAKEAVSPLARIETALHPWVGFVVMPVFALANAGVALDAVDFTAPLPLSIAVALLVGKPVGFLLGSFATVRAGFGRLPDDVGWMRMLGAGCLAGIGFTMSIFVASLAFRGDVLLVAKGGVLLGSAASALAGCAVLAYAGKGRARKRAHGAA